MGKFKIILSEQSARNHKLKADISRPKGLFVWCGGCNCVDWTFGFNKKLKWQSARHYGDWSLIKSLWRAIIDKDGFVTITRYL